MGNEQIELFSVLKAALWKEEAIQNPVSDTLCDELRTQAVAGLASTVVPQLADERFTHISKFVQMVKVQSETIRILQQAQIPAVVLKGTACGIYYPQPYLRAYGDIDILVHPRNYQSAIKLLADNGYMWNGSFGEIETTLFRYDFIIELHQSAPGLDRVAVGMRIHDYLIAGLEEIEIGKINNPVCEFPMLPWRLNGLEIIWHIREHLYNGLGLRQIIDWMMFVDCFLKDEESFEKFQIVLDQTGLTNLAIITTRMCQVYLGLDPGISWCSGADDEICAQLMGFVMEQGNFGNKKSDEKATRVLTRYGSISAFINKLQKEGLSSWPAFQRNRLLRPFAWIFSGGKKLSLYFPYLKRKQLIDSFRESRKRKALFDLIYGPDYGRIGEKKKKRNNTSKSVFK